MKTLRKAMEHSIPLLRLWRKQMWMEWPCELHWVPLFTFVFSKSEFTAFASVLHCNSSAVGTLTKAVNPDCSKFGQIGPTFVLQSQRHLSPMLIQLVVVSQNPDNREKDCSKALAKLDQLFYCRGFADVLKMLYICTSSHLVASKPDCPTFITPTFIIK